MNLNHNKANSKPAKHSAKSITLTALAVVIWLLVWQFASIAIGNTWLLSGPLDTLTAWFSLLCTIDFWEAVAHSLLRIAIGFIAAFILGCVLGYLAARRTWLRTLLKPAVLAIKSAPVVCIIALLLVAIGSNATTSVVVGLVVFTQFYHSVMEAVLSRDARMDETIAVFNVPRARRIFCYELVAFASSLRSSFAIAAGLAWKSGVAAEIIGLPGLSIGEGVYLAKISLDSASIIAWTATVILLSWITEKLLLALLRAAMLVPKRWLSKRVQEARDTHTQQPLQIQQPLPEGLDLIALKRKYLLADEDSQTVSFADLTINAGERICIMAPSGWGKTTLLRMLAGIDLPSSGQVRFLHSTQPSVSMVQQECTLLLWATALENIAFVSHSPSEINEGMQLCSLLLGKENLTKPASALSGGMKRRAELARALAHPSSLVLLDEPFAGLDAESKNRCAQAINQTLAGRTLILATHDENDADLLGCKIVHLQA